MNNIHYSLKYYYKKGQTRLEHKVYFTKYRDQKLFSVTKFVFTNNSINLLNSINNNLKSANLKKRNYQRFTYFVYSIIIIQALATYVHVLF